METERSHQDTLQSVLSDCYIDTVSREELEHEIELLSRGQQLTHTQKEYQKYLEDLPQFQKDELLSLEERMSKTNVRNHVRYTKVGFFRTIKAILYCLLAVPGAILHVLFFDKPYEV